MTDPKQPQAMFKENRLINEQWTEGCEIKSEQAMSDLDQICKGFDIGYSATIEYGKDGGQVVSLSTTEKGFNLAVARKDGSCYNIVKAPGKHYKVIGYKYMGELGGSGEIKEGTVFRNKEYGTRLAYIDEDSFGIVQLRDADDKRVFYRKDELEPYYPQTK